MSDTIDVGLTVTAETEVITAADKLAAIRAYADDCRTHVQYTIDPAKIIAMCDGNLR